MRKFTVYKTDQFINDNGTLHVEWMPEPMSLRRIIGPCGVNVEITTTEDEAADASESQAAKELFAVLQTDYDKIEEWELDEKYLTI